MACTPWYKFKTAAVCMHRMARTWSPTARLIFVALAEARAAEVLEVTLRIVQYLVNLTDYISTISK